MSLALSIEGMGQSDPELPRAGFNLLGYGEVGSWLASESPALLRALLLAAPSRTPHLYHHQNHYHA